MIGSPSRPLSRLLLFGAVAIVLGLMFEAGMRLYGGTEAAPVFQQLFMQDPRIGHRPRPGAQIRYATAEFDTTIAISSSGVRGPELGPKGPNERRIVALGDSIVLSVQVDQEHTFCQRLEDLLNGSTTHTSGQPPGTEHQAAPEHQAPRTRQAEGTTRNQASDSARPNHDELRRDKPGQALGTAHREGRGPSRYRVINAGVQGYGPVEEWLFFDHVVASLQPDLVLVFVFVANDAIEALDSASKLGPSADPGQRAAEDARTWARRAVRRSMVLQTLRMRYDAVKSRLRSAPVTQRPLLTYLEQPPAEVDRGLAIARDAFTRVRDRARRVGAETALVLVPARFQLDDADFGRLAQEVAATGGKLVRDAATARFAETLAPLGLPTLDLLPVLRAHQDPVSLFFQENVHFTVPGHEVVAGALHDFVAASGLLDARPAEPM